MQLSNLLHAFAVMYLRKCPCCIDFNLGFVALSIYIYNCFHRLTLHIALMNNASFLSLFRGICWFSNSRYRSEEQSRLGKCLIQVDMSCSSSIE
jgi:hypothetical protein